jgi:hypothetical protein
MTRFLDDLGDQFELRWKRATVSRKRELISELRELYKYLDNHDDLPVLAQSEANKPAPSPQQAAKNTPPTHEQVDLERELRLKLGLVIERMIEAELQPLRQRLRQLMRAEMDALIQETIHPK